MQFIEIIKEHIAYRQQIFKLAVSNLKKTYRGTALGWLWAIVKPMVTVFVYWFTFTIGLRAGHAVNGVPFFLWLVAGIMPWFYMSEMITGGTMAIRKYSYLVTKMKFPISTIPTFISISKFLIHLLLIAITIALFALGGFAPDIYLLQLPFYMLMMFLFFTLWALFSSLISCISKDFSNLVKSVTTAIFWLSGIIYNPNSLDIQWLKDILMFNPVTYIVTGYRNIFIDKVWFFEEPKKLVCFCIVLVIMFLLALWAYKKLKREISDVL